MNGSFDWNPGFYTKWGSRFSTAQRYVDSEVLRLSEPYTPFQVGAMINSGILGTDLGSGVVQWIAPYSRYQYYGKVMVGSAPKHVTNKDLVYHGGGLRGSFWFERMKEAWKDKIIAGASQVIRSLS